MAVGGRGRKALGAQYRRLLHEFEACPPEVFDPKILVVKDGYGDIVRVGPLGMLHLASQGHFEIRKREFRHPETDRRYTVRTLWANNRWAYLAAAIYLNLPAARVAEKLFHPDYYKRGPMTPKRVAERLRYLLEKLRSQSSAEFLDWFDQAYPPVAYTLWRGYYSHQLQIAAFSQKQRRRPFLWVSRGRQSKALQAVSSRLPGFLDVEDAK